MNKYSWRSIALGFGVCLIMMGCTAQNSPLGKEESYRPVDLSKLEGELTAEDPETIALNLFGNKEEPVEGNFSQEIEVIEQEGFKRTLMLTQMNLPDDSVKGLRYRLKFEFDQSTGQWGLVEAGTQQSCSRGDNSGNWTIELCP
ncbi:hypothetical protein [Crocosphaera sp.]|uniref:hypothetical protein n=1 Tax=Crocosphaera sp. TaxID=2729996 RepID=UPI0026324FCC|nr:hypothetical protein [Crocosphaera sp.]MDJ0580169.1 hypothetical protein [Crocosphaera sp.]